MSNLSYSLPYGPGVIYNGSTGCHGMPGTGGPGSWPIGPAAPLPGVPPPPGDPGLPAEEVLPDPAVPPPPALPISNPGVPANRGWSYRTVNDEGYPWTSSTLHMKNYPMPGSFFDANNPQGAHVFRGPEHFVRALLGSALVMAEMDTSLATSSAGASLRKELSDLHASSEFNDGLFGTSMTALTGGRRGVGPQDRGINWEPRHAPVRDLIGRGKKPYRTTGINGQRLDTYIEANHMPLVWNPAINLDLLRNERRISVEGMRWSDGRSMLEPPASVSALGIDASGVRFPGGMGYARSQGRGSARDWWDRKAV